MIGMGLIAMSILLLMMFSTLWSLKMFFKYGRELDLLGMLLSLAVFLAVLGTFFRIVDK